MSHLLQDKVVLITGGAHGIGRECALAFAREGARVAIADVDPDGAQKAVAALPVKGIAIQCDVSDGDSVDAAVKHTVSVYGRIDVVHNNVGISSPSKPLHETSEEEWDLLHRVNLKSLFWTTRSSFEYLKEAKGCILNTASMVGVIGQANHAAYVSTKGAMIALTKAMALDYAPHGIRVNAICPAGVWTPMLRLWAEEQENSSDIRKYLDRIHPLGTCPEGDVVADAAVFLISHHARFITGCVLPVSGGAELGYRL